MSYQLSKEEFLRSKMFDSKGKLSHRSGYRFKLFPFITRGEPVLELEPLVGTFLCMIEEIKTKNISATELCESLRKETDIEIGREELFDDMIKHLFFYSDGTIRPMNLELLEHVISKEASENRIADYLVDVLGDKKVLNSEVKKAKQIAMSSSNVLEKLVLSKLQFEGEKESNQEHSYYRITNSLKDVFEEDFIYVIGNLERSREYLVLLLELYYFSYTAQACLQLNRFLDGEREENIPLYFCLEWEKTSQSRMCFTEGWQKLQKAIEKIFTHAIVLELLNQTEKDSEVVDYIRIAEMITGETVDAEIGKQIDDITICYRNAINDCAEMNDLSKKTSSQGPTADSIRYLFDSVKTQFEFTVRDKPNKAYTKHFERYCYKFLKNRGRSGMMLNLTEEMLIFVTRLCIKKQEKMRLNEVFKAFEKRGVYLDAISKEQVASYYEKLNLIEKKSDSGDAKYVKRIL